MHRIHPRYPKTLPALSLERSCSSTFQVAGPLSTEPFFFGILLLRTTEIAQLMLLLSRICCARNTDLQVHQRDRLFPRGERQAAGSGERRGECQGAPSRVHLDTEDDGSPYRSNPAFGLLRNVSWKSPRFKLVYTLSHYVTVPGIWFSRQEVFAVHGPGSFTGGVSECGKAFRASIVLKLLVRALLPQT